MSRTQEERKTETAGRLLDAAATLFARHGFDGVSIDAVAEAAGRTSGAVYAHFGGKEGLLFSLLSSWETRAAGVMGDVLEGIADPDARPAALWSSFVAGSDPWMLLEHELWLYAARHPGAAAEVARRYRSGRRGMADAFERWSNDAGDDVGDVADPTPAELAVVVMALLLGLEMQRRVEPDAVPDDLAARALAAVLGHPTGSSGLPGPTGSGESSGSTEFAVSPGPAESGVSSEPTAPAGHRT